MNASIRRPFFSLIVLWLLFGLIHGSAASAAIPISGAISVLELEGRPVATLRSFTGGTMTGDVVVSQIPSGCCFSNKHLASVRAEDIVVEVAGELRSDLVGWIQDNLNGDPVGRDGSIVMLDYNGREVRRINFVRGLIAEIGLPAFNATSATAFSLTLRITPEQARLMKGSGRAYNLPYSKQKSWLTNNFRLDIPGVDTSRVSAIDAITLKRKIGGSVGEFRDYSKPIGPFEISPLAMTLSETGAAGFDAWYQDFVVKGNADDSRELEGTITLLTPDLRTSLLTLSLHHLGIYRFAYDYGSSTSGAAVRAQAYIESVSMTGGIK
jgi:hypothetical protein